MIPSDHSRPGSAPSRSTNAGTGLVAARSGEGGTVEDALLAAEAELETVEDAPMRALVALAHRLLAEAEAGPDRTPDDPADASGLLGPGWLVALAAEPAGTG